jgi:hypothetical protein
MQFHLHYFRNIICLLFLIHFYQSDVVGRQQTEAQMKPILALAAGYNKGNTPPPPGGLHITPSVSSPYISF